MIREKIVVPEDILKYVFGTYIGSEYYFVDIDLNRNVAYYVMPSYTNKGIYNFNDVPTLIKTANKWTKKSHNPLYGVNLSVTDHISLKARILTERSKYNYNLKRSLTNEHSR